MTMNARLRFAASLGMLTGAVLMWAAPHSLGALVLALFAVWSLILLRRR